MINEVAEYDYYINALSSDEKTDRLLDRIIKKDNRCYINRAVVLIIRHTLFENGEPWEEDGLIDEAICEKAIDAARDWTVKLVSSDKFRERAEKLGKYKRLQSESDTFGGFEKFALENDRAHLLFKATLERASELGYLDGNSCYNSFAVETLNCVFSEFDPYRFEDLSSKTNDITTYLVRAVDEGPLKSYEGFCYKNSIYHDEKGKLKTETLKWLFVCAWYKACIETRPENRQIQIFKQDFSSNLAKRFPKKNYSWKEWLNDWHSKFYDVKDSTDNVYVSLNDEDLEGIRLVKSCSDYKPEEGWTLISDEGVNTVI